MRLVYIALIGSDLYCYYDQGKMKQRFMHSLSGCCMSSDTSDSEFVQGTMYYTLIMKLSDKFKRVFYFRDSAEREAWRTALRIAG